MRYSRLTWLISISILLIGCSRSNGRVSPPAAEAKVPDNFVAPEYAPAQGGGPGVTVDGRIIRGSRTVGYNNFPTWKVELTVANHTTAAIRLGESMTVLEKLSNLDEMAGIYVARESKQPTGHLKRMATRYGLLWGLPVGVDTTGVWPFGALPGGSSLSGLDLLVVVVSMPIVKPYYPDGGYPSVPAGQQVLIREEIVVPLKKPSESTILLAPAVVEEGKAPVRFALWFSNVGSATEGQAFVPIESKTYSPADPALALLPGDAAQPAWLRLHALNWLAETRFEETVPTLMKFASDLNAPLSFRVAALLNLGLHQYKPAVPLLLNALGNESDALQRAVAVAALGDIGDPANAARMRPLLNDPDETVVRETIASMGKLRDAESVVPLLNLLVDPKREKHYDEIASALAEIGTPEALSGLVRISADRKSGKPSRTGAIAALGKAAHRPAVAMLSAVSVDESDDSLIRSAAIHALAKIGGPEAWVAIRTACGARDQSVGETALRAMSQSKDEAHRAYVIEVAGKAGDPLQQTALKQITQEKLNGAGSTLRTVIHSPLTPAKVLPDALRALAATGDKIGPDDLAPLWAAYQKESDPSIGEALVDALAEAKFSDRSVIPHLMAGLDEDKNKLWYSHVKLLRQVSGQTIGPEFRYGEKGEHRADFNKWREWWAQQPK